MLLQKKINVSEFYDIILNSNEWRKFKEQRINEYERKILID